ncbi:hypothetical protein B5E73_09220 [Ligilactobacillus salivarius]|uniref:tyrosine-type recombinase/integrase n=1 Tax=Ligilactobacillus salivarius TaxID=1624 RepID=UPI000B39E935|nr:tyrosine-type recombinase/integrase [Ligilactobacillus salivarius]OUQ29890.1 hypothetical protein B5E73_09220 [Ligilactobacillus salivarius]
MVAKTKTNKKINVVSDEIRSEPLKDEYEIELVRRMIRDHTKEPLRNLIIFNLGINNGIRTNDILKLKISDVWGKEYTTIRESKTGKQREIRLNVANLQEDIKAYVGNRKWNDSTYLFTSYKDPAKPIQTVAVYRMFKRINKVSGGQLPHLTAHSMRRTFGYQYYKKTHDIVTLMKLFNHSKQAITLRYIGIEREEIRNSLRDFEL